MKIFKITLLASLSIGLFTAVLPSDTTETSVNNEISSPKLVLSSTEGFKTIVSIPTEG